MFIHNRLTIHGPKRALDSFEKSNWLERLRGKHPELYEAGTIRRTWWFETAQSAMADVARFSERWPRLIFVLQFESEDEREVGLVKAAKGRLDQCRFNY